MRHPILPLFPEKFFADTADMTPDGAAYYLVLLAHAWVRGGSLPNDPDKLRLMLRLPRMRWARLRHQILEKWTLGEDGRLHQKRMDEEWQRRERHTAEVLNGVTEKREKPRRNEQRVMAKKQAITTRAHAPDPSPSPPSLNSYSIAGLEKGAGASLRVLEAHASRPLRLVTNTEPSQPPDDAPAAEVGKSETYRRELPEITEAYRPEDRLSPAERVRIADEIVAKLAAEIARDKLTEPRAGTIAELERKAAEEKLAALEAAAEKPMLALSPTTRASRLLASAETAYGPENGNAANAQG